MLDMQARHLKVTMTRQPEAGACDAAKTRVEMDGWYVDFETPEIKGASADHAYAAFKPECEDDTRYQQTGQGKLGYPVAYSMKSWKGDEKTQP